MKLWKELAVRPGKRVKLAHYDPEATPGYKKGDKAHAETEKTIARLDELQYLLYAENKHALLVVLQGMDTSGKDGTIRHVMSGLNPQWCKATNFKAPTPEEAEHDFLWRIHHAVPRRGEVGIFNRSQYEDVLAARVHNLAPQDVWSERYDQINRFERYLADNNVVVLKFFLHISKDEQRQRILDRIDDPRKNWKLSPADFAERKFWPAYLKAYEVALTRCNTKHAPWFIIPANKKWYRNLAVAKILVETLEELNMKYPKPAIDLSEISQKFH
jgi:PPK2 family polyphosphate:nucleotide phosphotransferase